jgi:hypothetical protein
LDDGLPDSPVIVFKESAGHKPRLDQALLTAFRQRATTVLPAPTAQPEERTIPEERTPPQKLPACEGLIVDDPAVLTSSSAFVPTTGFRPGPDTALKCELGDIISRLKDLIAQSFINASAVQRARIIQGLVDRNDTEGAFELLSKLPTMRELLDTLRVERLLPDDTFAPNKAKATFLGPLSQAAGSSTTINQRVALGLRIVTNRTLPEKDILNTLPVNEQEAVQSFVDVRDWPTQLRRSGRKSKEITVQDRKLTKKPLPAELAPSDHQKQIVDYIKRARANVPDRSRNLRAADGGFQYSGNKDRNPDPTQVKPPDPAQLSEESANQKRRREFNGKVWGELQNEGQNSATVTHQDTKLIWGHGFTGVQLVQVVQEFLKNDEAARNELLDAGIAIGQVTVNRGTPQEKQEAGWLIVDTETGLIEESDNALRLIQLDTQVLSLLIEIAEDSAHAQAFADAQFTQLQKPGPGHAAGITDKQLEILNQGEWAKNPRFVKFASHAVHRGNPQWSDFLAIPPDQVSAKALIRVFGLKVGEDTPNADGDKGVNGMGAKFVRKSATREMMAFAKLGREPGLAREVLTTSTPLPPEMRISSSVKSDKFAGAIFFRDPDRDASKTEGLYFLI